jgi:transcriptional accessory protein Tex/SPT6
MTNENKIADLKEQLEQLLLQVAITQKSIIALGGEYANSYCGCCMAVCDEQYEPIYNHLDAYIKIMTKKTLP